VRYSSEKDEKGYCFQRHWWLMPVILAMWEAVTRRISLLGQLWQIV
jgi:hypothetical protein